MFHVRYLQFFGLLHYIEAIISDEAAQSSECLQLHCNPSIPIPPRPPLPRYHKKKSFFRFFVKIYFSEGSKCLYDSYLRSYSLMIICLLLCVILHFAPLPLPFPPTDYTPPPFSEKKLDLDRCQNSLTRELKIRFVGLVLKQLFTNS